MRKYMDENFVCERCGTPFPEVGRGAYIEGKIVCLKCKEAWDAHKARFFENANLEAGIYPLTIVRDRYTGDYSGGAYTAWKHYVDEIPREIRGNDGECREFWYGEKAEQYKVGKGATIAEAVADLARKMGVAE